MRRRTQPDWPASMSRHRSNWTEAGGCAQGVATYVRFAVLLAAVLAMQAAAAGQARRGQPARPPAQPALVTEAAKVSCPQVLGEGVRTKRTFCDVSIGLDPA